MGLNKVSSIHLQKLLGARTTTHVSTEMENASILETISLATVPLDLVGKDATRVSYMEF